MGSCTYQFHQRFFDIMFCLLIIILDSPGCTCLDQNLKSLLSFFILKLWLKINSQPKSRFSNLMEVVSTPLMSLNTTCHNKASSIKLLVVTPFSKIVLLRGNTCISLRPLSHFCHKHLCPHPNGHMLCTLTLINLLPTFVPSFQSPWYKLHFSPPDLSQLRVFGCACYPHLRSYTTHKLESRTKECIFLGYPSTSKGYLCPDLQIKQLYTSRHVLFNKSKFPFSLLTPFALTSSSSPIFPDPLWLSNQLYLHSTNHPSLLGAYPSSSSTFVSISSSFPQALSVPLDTQNTSNRSSPPTLSINSNTSHLDPSSVLPAPASLHESTQLSSTLTTFPFVSTSNHHPMQTRSKSGITRPKSKFCYKAILDYTYIELPSYKIAYQYPKWCEPMDAEFQALQKQ